MIKQQINTIESATKAYNFYQLFFIFSIWLLVFSIPFHRVSSSIPSILLVFSLILFLRNLKINLLKFGLSIIKSPYFILLNIYLFIYLFLFLLDQHNSNAAFTKLVLLPFYFICFYAFFKHFKIDLIFFINTFLISLLIFSFFILFLAFLNYKQISYKAFFYINLLKPIKASPIIHSFYYNLAIIFIGYKLKLTKNKIKKLVLIVILLIMILMVGLCAAKIGYIILFISLPVALWLIIKLPALKVAGILVFVVSTIAIYSKVNFVHKKINGFSWQLKNHDKISMNDKLPRSIIWPIAVKLINENFIKGVGVGSSSKYLIPEFEKINYQKGVEGKFNAHNQFLESGLQLGFFGLIVFFSLIIYCFYMALRYKSSIYFFYLVILFCYLSIESLLEIQMGIVSFGVFNGMFLTYFSITPSPADFSKPLNL